MRTELTEKIIGWVKGVFNLSPESTEAEIHEHLVNASDDIKADLVVNVANQIAVFAGEEIKKQSEAFAEQLKIESAEIIEQLNAKLTILETKLSDLENAAPVVTVDPEAINELRKEFADQILEIKAAKGFAVDGDGKVIDKTKATKETPPATSVWRTKA